MFVTELGITIPIKPIQYANDFSPMDVTDVGMVKDERLLHPANAP